MRSRVAKKAHKKAIRKPPASSVVSQTTEYKRLLRVVADAESAKADASFAVHLLSDDWVTKSASLVGTNSPMVLVRDIPSDVRETYSNVAKKEIARLDALVKESTDAAFNIQVEVFKLMGHDYHMLWSATVNDVPTRRTEDYQRWLPPM
jgi:hypothetical protein